MQSTQGCRPPQYCEAKAIARLARLAMTTSEGMRRSGEVERDMAVIWYRAPEATTLCDISHEEEAADEEQQEGGRDQRQSALDEVADRRPVETQQRRDDEESGAARRDGGEDEHGQVEAGQAASDGDDP